MAKSGHNIRTTTPGVETPHTAPPDEVVLTTVECARVAAIAAATGKAMAFLGVRPHEGVNQPTHDESPIALVVADGNDPALATWAARVAPNGFVLVIGHTPSAPSPPALVGFDGAFYGHGRFAEWRKPG